MRTFLTSLFFLVLAKPALSQIELSGRFVNYTSYFTEKERIRHNRFELHLLQSAKINANLSSVVEGRFRFDAALYPSFGAFRDAPKSVRDDEMTEAEGRQIYLDYLSDVFALKVGLQQIDWVDSLSPRTSDVITPLDLRYGGNGSAKELIEPMFALVLNHPAPFGSFEWLFIPEGKHHRLPRGTNGYGYYEALTDDGNNNVTLSTQERKRHISESEGGARYLMRFDSVEFTLLGFHGHQRYPALRVNPLDVTGIRRDVTETYPQTNTFGGSVVYGGDALVARMMIYHEPKRQPGVFTERSPLITTLPSGAKTTAFVDNRQLYERRTKYGVGLDYVFSKDLKFYSEHFLTKYDYYYDGDQSAYEAPLREKHTQRITNSVRLTNETFDHWLFSLDATLVGPEKGRSFGPQITFTSNDYKCSIGANIFASDAKDSAFEPLKNTDQIYLSLERFFAVAGHD